MKVWKIRMGNKVIDGSLLQMDAGTQTASYSTKIGNVILKFKDRFDFAEAKNGEIIVAQVIGKRQHISCIITFK